MMKDNEQLVFEIAGKLDTSPEGVSVLINLYEFAAKYKNVTISVDFYKMSWFDANLSALFFAITYRLKKEKGVRLSTDYTFLSNKFPILFHNGWLQHEKIQVEPSACSYSQCRKFEQTETEDFFKYISTDLLKHESLNHIAGNVKGRIEADLVEVFQNLRHARTSDPCFICGQLFKNTGYFVLSIIDLGVGFLPPIKEFTKGTIQTSAEAIKWALSGMSIEFEKTTKPIAGLGLVGILEYAQSSNGILQIYSGTDFWGTDLTNTIYQGSRALSHDFKGSLINLFFKV